MFPSKSYFLTIFLPRLLGVFFCIVPLSLQAQEITGEEIVKKCEYKYPGEDQRSKLTIILKDKDGTERKNVYLRLWKDYKGKDQIADKMVLYTEYPPDAKGTAFMRWAFIPGTGKNADQWIYLPALRKTRPVSVRDPGDSFLGSDLTYADISGRTLEEDKHQFLKIDKQNGRELYVVESIPKEEKPLYSKRVSWFTKTPDWDSCVKVGVAYYDTKGNLLKKQSLSWQKVKDAWMWKQVEVQNVQTSHASIFQVEDAEVNVGLEDEQFTERALRKDKN